MTRKWSARLVALGGLVLALGCRSHPATPVCSTPLLPGEVVTNTAPVPSAPPMGALLPGQSEQGPGIQPPSQFSKLPDSKAPDIRLPGASPDVPTIRPPSDVAGQRMSRPTTGEPVRGPEPRLLPTPGTAPVVKPLLIEAPRPLAGPDGFAPAPIIAPPEPPVATIPVKPPVEELKPALPLRPGQQFGHAPDYKWVAGILDRHQKGGYWTIRFADSGTDDPWGGKVRLLSEDRLAGFESGDVVYVEGELLAPRTAADNTTYPPYRVTEVRLVEKMK